MKQSHIFSFSLLFLIFFALGLFGSRTEFEEIDRKSEFFQAARMEGIVISKEGRLQIGPDVDGFHVEEEQSFYASARMEEGRYLLGSGKGNLYMHTGSEINHVADTDLNRITDIIYRDDSGFVTGKPGHVKRVTSDGNVRTVAELPDVDHGWKLLDTGGNDLLVAGGTPAVIFRVSLDGNVEELYRWENVERATELFQSNGVLYAGTASPGYLARIHEGRMFVVQNFGEDSSVSSIGERDGQFYISVNSRAGELPYQIMNAGPESDAGSEGGESDQESSESQEEEEAEETGDESSSGEQQTGESGTESDNADTESSEQNGESEAGSDSGDSAEEQDDASDPANLTGTWEGVLNPEMPEDMPGDAPEPPELEFTMNIEQEGTSVSAELVPDVPSSAGGNAGDRTFQLEGTFQNETLELSGEMERDRVTSSLEMELTLQNKDTLEGRFSMESSMGPQTREIEGDVRLQRSDGEGSTSGDDGVGREATGGPSGSRPRPSQITETELDADSSLWKMTEDGAEIRKVMDMKFYVHKLAVTGGRLMASSDSGMIFEIFPGERTYAGVASVPESSVPDFSASEGHVNRVFTAGEEAGAYRIHREVADRGVLTSQVINTEARSTWGVLNCIKEGTVQARIRIGNVSDPESGWSDWSESREIGTSGLKVNQPDAQFIQFQLIFTDTSASVEAVELGYANRNRTPFVETISVDKSWNPDVFAPFDSRPSRERQVSWEAGDPDGDALEYTLFRRKIGRSEWIRMTDQPIGDQGYTWNTGDVADGRYRLRVVASDRPVHGRTEGLTDSAISGVVVVDNTRPDIDISRREEVEGGMLIEGSVSDETSAISAIQIHAGGSSWQTIPPEDGIYDRKEESFRYTLAPGEAGSGPIRIRVFDRQRNSKTVLVD